MVPTNEVGIEREEGTRRHGKHVGESAWRKEAFLFNVQSAVKVPRKGWKSRGGNNFRKQPTDLEGGKHCQNNRRLPDPENLWKVQCMEKRKSFHRLRREASRERVAMQTRP